MFDVKVCDVVISVRFKIDGDATYCYVMHSKEKVGVVAFAKLHPKDTFNQRIGECVALERALMNLTYFKTNRKLRMIVWAGYSKWKQQENKGM